MVHVLGFVGHTVLVTTAQLRRCSTKADTENMTRVWLSFNKTLFMKQLAGCNWLTCAQF